MPAHIYYRVGRYQDSAEINELAAAADVAYFSWCRAPAAYAALYYPHNLHFLWASEMIEGNSDGAMIAARRIVAQIPADQLAAFPFLEDYLVTPYYTQARFGKWDQILGEPKPPADQRFVTAIWHYARGLAYTRTRKPAEAQAEFAALEAIAGDEEFGALVYDTSSGTAGQRLDDRETSPGRRAGGGPRRPQGGRGRVRGGDRDPGRDALQRAPALLLARAPATLSRRPGRAPTELLGLSLV